jgi:hypothetical protein
MYTRKDCEILGRLVKSDEDRGRPDSFTLTYKGGMGGPKFAGREWPEGVPVPEDVQVDELASLGWVRVTELRGKMRVFAVTNAGRAAWDEYEAQL